MHPQLLSSAETLRFLHYLGPLDHYPGAYLMPKCDLLPPKSAAQVSPSLSHWLLGPPPPPHPPPPPRPPTPPPPRHHLPPPPQTNTHHIEGPLVCTLILKLESAAPNQHPFLGGTAGLWD